MSGFSAGWLALREPADHAARRDRLAAALAAWLATRPGPVRIVDLGCGSGSNLRWLAPRLPPAQRWLLVDDDAALLETLPERLRAFAGERGEAVRKTDEGLRIGEGCAVRWQHQDLAVGVPDPAGHALVTAAALVDLVSRPWLEGLLADCARSRAAVLLALTYDGRMAFEPGDAGDAAVRDAVNEHQHRDKGFGPALGPDGVAAATGILRRHGYRVVQARSDWRLGPARRELAAALVEGWHDAAVEQRPGARGEVSAWRRRRLAALDRPGARLVVGHADVLALPPR